MSERKDKQRDSEAARGRAAEESSRSQPTHYHSSMESSTVEGHACERGGARACDRVSDETRRRGVRAQPPEEFTGGEVREAKEVAGGLPAVWETTKHTAREMGLVRGVRTLLRLNQKDGFDCPGCAWPDPEGERSHVEFCENGAKAVAEEATVRRVMPEFFKQWSVPELSQKSDYWLGKQGRITHPVVLRRDATHYEPIAWDEAFRLLAEELNALSSPDAAAFYPARR